MKRLVLDAGPLIALVSIKDDYHQECKAGFSKLPALFGEVLTPLPVLFEVYKFVLRELQRFELVQESRIVVPLVQLGKVYGNRMVDVAVTNDKIARSRDLRRSRSGEELGEGAEERASPVPGVPTGVGTLSV